MSTMTFKPATKKDSKLRLALIGASGTGKTYTALSVAQYMGKKIALIDTEHGSASKYADLFKFDTLQLKNYHPKNYVEAINAAATSGYDVLVIDSLSHEWMGKGGIIQIVDEVNAKDRSGNGYAGWSKATPLHNDFISTILDSNIHIIATIRAKVQYIKKRDKTGETHIVEKDITPIQRDGVEYEFDVVGKLDQSNNLTITKTRCPALDKATIHQAGQDLAVVLSEWLQGSPLPLERIDKLEVLIKDLGFDYEQTVSLARDVTGRDIADLTTLTETEAADLWNAASSQEQGASIAVN